MLHRILIAGALASLLPAQQSKVVPVGMDHVEGPSVFTSPFSRATDGIQLVIDASEIGSGQTVLTGLYLRPSQATQFSPGFVKSYRLDAYTVTTAAATLEAMASPYDPNLVIAGATPTTVFNGPLQLPAGGPLAVTPAPFSIYLPFNPPYVYDSNLGNLLLMLETTDLAPTPGTYRVDAVQFRFSPVSGVVADIDGQGCLAGGQSMLSATLDDTVILGGSIDTTLTSSSAGAFPAALVVLGFERIDTDLGLIGMPGCLARLGGTVLTQFVLETPGGYPLVSWTIPVDPIFHGVPVYTQTLGFAASGTFADNVTSNAEAMRIGEPSVTVRAMCGFHTVAGTTDAWFHGTSGQFTPVVKLEGVFP